MDSKKQKLKIILLIVIDVIFVALCFLQIFRPVLNLDGLVLFNPKGLIAAKQKNLILTALSLMLIAVVPAFVMLFLFVRKYRAGNQADYEPDRESSKTLAVLWWAIPSVVIFALAFLIWHSTHELDPYKPIASNVKPITIQVVALRWKWLFIYPDQNIATINFLEFPKDTPINFELTADDSPMTSFWIPQLGGQMYAMTGMTTQHHLMATDLGEFQGSNAEISGPGFAGMRFIAKATSQNDFDNWLTSVKKTSTALTSSEYQKLLQPTENNKPAYYTLTDDSLYNNVMMKYMMPMSANQQ